MNMRFLKCVCILALLILPNLATASDRPSADMQVFRNIAYNKINGSNQNLTSLDLYASKKSSALPVIIWIHGGGWSIGDKSRVLNKPKAFLEKGFIFVSVNYRLFPEVDYSDQAGDIASAIHWLHNNVKNYGGNPQRLYLMGHSAGAHLVALVATDDRYLKEEKLPLKTIKGVILLDGAAYNLSNQSQKMAGPRLRRLYGKVFGNDDDELKNASPISHINKGKGIPPFLLLYVASRRNSKRRSQELETILRKAGISAISLSAENKTHATINREIGLKEDEPTIEVFKFLNQIEKSRRKLKRR